jgi:hypothetical protein
MLDVAAEIHGSRRKASETLTKSFAIMRNFAVNAALIICILSPVQAHAARWRCDLSEKWNCQPGQGGCQAALTGIVNYIDTGQEKYSRCDQNGCDTFDARLSTSGIFVHIDLPGRGVFAKMASDGSMFLETATLMMTTLVSFGKCKPA